MKIFALLALLLSLPTLTATAQSNAIPVIATVSTNGVTVAVHDQIKTFYTNVVIVSTIQIVRTNVYEQDHQVTSVRGQRRTSVVYNGLVSSALGTNVIPIAYSQQPGFPPPPIAH